MKTCIKCREAKGADAFRMRATGRQENTCRTCMAEHARSWRRSNTDKAMAGKARYYTEHREEIRARDAAWRAANPDYRAPSARTPGYATARWRRYRDANKATLYAKKNEYARERRQRDPVFKLAGNLRSRVVAALRRRTAASAGSPVRDIGCSLQDLKTYLASKFQPGMSWDNWGTHGWHIDHITPLAAFDLSNREQFKQAVHYTNLQPLWAEDNWKKNDRMVA